MLNIRIGEVESYDDEKKEFVYSDGIPLELEHSLVSLSKWEAIHQKPFLGKEDKTNEELLSYIECMIADPNPPADILSQLTDRDVERINDYINSKQTATWFGEDHEKPTREIITSELIYYWMITAQIPIEFEHWHLNRLFTLLKVINVKNEPPKKMSPRQIAERNRKLNEERLAKLKTRG